MLCTVNEGAAHKPAGSHVIHVARQAWESPSTDEAMASVEDANPADRKELPRPVPLGLPAGSVDGELGVSSDVVYANMQSLEQRVWWFRPGCRCPLYRRYLVDWMSEIGEAFLLARSTTHVAIGYLDRLLQLVVVPNNRLQLVALCCIVIAAKYEEAEERVPAIPRLCEYTNCMYRAEQIHHTEVLVLQRLDWNLSILTPPHVLGYFFRKGVLFSDDTIAAQPLSVKVPRYMRKYMDFFADLCQQEFGFQQYRPTLLAAAIILASRTALKITPCWNAALEDVMWYSEADVKPCFSVLWAFFCDNFPAATEGVDSPDGTVAVVEQTTE